MAETKETKAASKEVPGYVPTKDIAVLFGLTVRRIQQLTQDGIIQTNQTAAGRRYNVVATTKAYIAYLQDKVNGKVGNTEDSKLESEKLSAEVEIKQTKAAVEKLRLKELEGTMHRSEDVEALTTDLVFAIRSMIMALPGRLAVDVSDLKTPAEVSERIQQEINEILRELANYKYDPEEYKRRVRDRQGWSQETEDNVPDD